MGLTLPPSDPIMSSNLYRTAIQFIEQSKLFIDSMLSQQEHPMEFHWEMKKRSWVSTPPLLVRYFSMKPRYP